MCIKEMKTLPRVSLKIVKSLFRLFSFFVSVLEGLSYFAMCSLAFVPDPHNGMTIVSVSQRR